MVMFVTVSDGKDVVWHRSYTAREMADYLQYTFDIGAEGFQLVTPTSRFDICKLALRIGMRKRNDRERFQNVLTGKLTDLVLKAQKIKRVATQKAV